MQIRVIKIGKNPQWISLAKRNNKYRMQQAVVWEQEHQQTGNRPISKR